MRKTGRAGINPSKTPGIYPFKARNSHLVWISMVFAVGFAVQMKKGLKLKEKITRSPTTRVFNSELIPPGQMSCSGWQACLMFRPTWKSHQIS